MIVRKRQGGTENWDKQKLIASMMNAGLQVDEARCIGSLIETVVINQIPEPVDSSRIREMVIGILKAVDSGVANIYENFSK